MTLYLEVSVFARAHAQLSNVYRTSTYLHEPHERNKWNTSIYIKIDSQYYLLSGRKDLSKYGVGDDISLPPCLAMGSWYLKISSPKQSRGRNLREHRYVLPSGTTSRGTVIIFSLYGKIRCSEYFVYACASVLNLKFHHICGKISA